jgi:UTP--glucose-1-phosphate uridylyltransferase
MVRVRSAIIPAAGWGTRMLPASAAIPKELLPVYDRPSLELVVAEAVAAGCDRIVLVSSRGKSSLLDHFDRLPYLENLLRQSGKAAQADAFAERAQQATFLEVRQGEALGLGHAVLCGAPACAPGPVAVLLPDDLYLGSPAALGELIDVHAASGKGVIGLLRIPPAQSRRYGMVSGDWEGNVFAIDRLVEKPAPEEAPSDLAITGRYVLPETIFDALRTTGRGALGEIQLTDALDQLVDRNGMCGIVPTAPRYDAGHHGGLLLAGLRCALDSDQDGSLRTQIEAELAR